MPRILNSVIAAGALPVLAALVLSSPRPAAAATLSYLVNTAAELESYFAKANADPANTYSLSLRSTTPYVLSKPLKLTKGTVKLKGYGTASLDNAGMYVVDGGFPTRFQQVFVIDGTGSATPPYLSLRGITIQNGYGDQISGGGISCQHGGVNIENSIIRKNQTSRLGAGLYAASGGWIYLFNSIIRDNTNTYFTHIPQTCGGQMASGGGLAVWGSDASLRLENTTVMGNKTCRGGGIAVYYGGNLSMLNSTVSGNQALKSGGGLYLLSSVNVDLAFNTITKNQGGLLAETGGEERYGGGLAMLANEGTLALNGNILADNEMVSSDKKTLFYDGHDCYDRSPGFSVNRHISYSDNVIGRLANCSVLGSDGWANIGSEVDPLNPQLNPLTMNSGIRGYQYTHAPKPTSPVIGWFYYSTFPCLYNDQLGHRRDWYDHESYAPNRCDYGSHQYNWYH
jgi:parallel beta-helix repeat protein